MDRRIQKTEQSIKDSFLSLLQTTDIHKITVKDICTKANINRCTFYSHYQDIRDLFEHIGNEFTTDFLNSLELYQYDMNSKEVIDNLFSCMKQHKQLFLLMASSHNPSEAVSLIPVSMREHILGIWLKESDLTYEEADMLFTFIVTGGNSILQKWVQSDFAMEEEKVKNLFENAIKYGLYNFVYTK